MPVRVLRDIAASTGGWHNFKKGHTYDSTTDPPMLPEFQRRAVGLGWAEVVDRLTTPPEEVPPAPPPALFSGSSRRGPFGLTSVNQPPPPPMIVTYGPAGGH